MTTAKTTTKKSATNKSAIDSIVAQSGAIAITIKTRSKTSAKTIKALEPLATAMLATGEATSTQLLSRLPQNTVAFKVFSSQVLGTAQLFSWFDENQASLTRTTKDGKTLLDIAGAYCAAFGIIHDKAHGALKNMPFYKKLSNALQQWAKRQGGFEKRASGSVTDAVAAYLNKKDKEDSKALSDSLTAWVLKSPPILARIKKALETPAA